MVVEPTTRGLSPTIRRRIADLRVEAARLRAELGDPEEALSTFVHHHFEQDALAAALQDELTHAIDVDDDQR